MRCTGKALGKHTGEPRCPSAAAEAHTHREGSRGLGGETLAPCDTVHHKQHSTYPPARLENVSNSGFSRAGRGNRTG